jgi:hypothetical protein
MCFCSGRSPVSVAEKLNWGQRPSRVRAEGPKWHGWSRCVLSGCGLSEYSQISLPKRSPKP